VNRESGKRRNSLGWDQNSLVGSYFTTHAPFSNGPQPHDKGVVVAHVADDLYLVEFFTHYVAWEWKREAPHQELVPREEMRRWYFYDSLKELDDWSRLVGLEEEEWQKEYIREAVRQEHH
jgi:hypothetical protein